MDKPAESAVERYNALEWVPDGEMGFDPGGREVKAAADDAIAELKAEVERLKVCGNCQHHDIRHDPYGECEDECDQFTDYEHGQLRAEAAEAKLALANDELRLGSDEIEDAQEQRDEARRERDRLMDAQARANAVIDVARRMASYRKRGGPRPLWNEFREELARYDARHEDGDG